MISVLSVRTAILQAYSIDSAGGCALAGGAGGVPPVSSTHRLACRYEAAKVIAAVEALPVDLRAWVLWAYGPALVAVTRNVQEGAVRALAAVVDMPTLVAELSERKALRVQLLAYAHMENHRALAVTGANKHRKPSHLDHAVRRISGGSVGLDLQGRNYDRDYGWLADVVASGCADLDAAALPPVGAALRSIHGFREGVSA